MTAPLILHYAPDNASLCVRLVLEELGMPFETRLVDRRKRGHKDPAYLAMNPNGLIPVLETPSGPMFETAAILLWLADQRPGASFPDAMDPARGPALTRLFWLSNTLHITLRMTFYPDQYLATAADDLRTSMRAQFEDKLKQLETSKLDDWLDGAEGSILACYLGPLLRWAGVYGNVSGWQLQARYPRLYAFAKIYEQRGAVVRACAAEGLGPTPFSNPQPANPPEGTPT